MSTLINNIHIDQENVQSRMAGKNATHAPPVRRPALDDLGNKLQGVQNKIEKTKLIGPPVLVPRKKIGENKQKVPIAVDKENHAKPNKAKESTTNQVQKKPMIRQESILAAKLNKTQAEKQVHAIYDPDEKDKNDPQMVTEYIQDILPYLRNIEIEHPIKANILDNTKITPKMRATLVNWLVEAHQNFGLTLDTLFLCVNIVDRYTQVTESVDRAVYQLVGSAALCLASKYEEIYTPGMQDFVFICDNAFTMSQLLKMERNIIKKLDFRMSWPTSIYFLRRYSKVARVTDTQHILGKYILELALLEYSVVGVRPSLQAAAACCLSIALLLEVMDPARVWTPTLVHYTTYKYADFKNVVFEFAKIILKAENSKFDAVKLKYSKPKHYKISLNSKLQGPLIRKLTTTTADAK